jgi:hypothetical protein
MHFPPPPQALPGHWLSKVQSGMSSPGRALLMVQFFSQVARLPPRVLVQYSVHVNTSSLVTRQRLASSWVETFLAIPSSQQELAHEAGAKNITSKTDNKNAFMVSSKSRHSMLLNYLLKSTECNPARRLRPERV